MNQMKSEELIRKIRSEACVLSGGWDDYDFLLDRIGEAHFVLLGEASHGTHEFYRMRAEITQRLVEEKGFNAVAVEADWPDAFQINRFVQAMDGADEAIDSLEGFRRFPTWMWRNADVLDFIGWLRDHNDHVNDIRKKCGFYGLDLYSLYRSVQEVISYLETMDPQAAMRARERYSCFDRFKDSPHEYGQTAHFNISESCQRAVMEQLLEIQHRESVLIRNDGRYPLDEHFYLEQNARLVKNAEEYYRSLFRGSVISWNLRDKHMFETLRALSEFLERRQGKSKIIVWAHNSHVGNARFTEMGERGEWNIGQLVRERYRDEAFIVGFTTHQGTVTAASSWDALPERMNVRPALSGSYEELFHEAGIARFLLTWDDPHLTDELNKPLLERAIGVVYQPQTERFSHYFFTALPQQFNAVIHVDVTRAVEPLEKNQYWLEGEFPETYPSGF